MAPPTSSETLRVPAFRRKKSLSKVKRALSKKPKMTAKKMAKKLTATKVKKMPKFKNKVMKAVKPKMKRPSIAPTPRKTVPRLQPVGMVTHYYDRIGVGVIKVSNTIRLGDRLRFAGKQGEFDETVNSMQAEHKSIDVAKKGNDIGLKVNQEVKTGKIAYRVL